jgi:hypothetical protein
MVVVAVGAGLAAAAAAQVEVDRTLQRVYGTPIMASDVRQVRLLKLVPEAGSDAAALTALENRLLILREVSRVAAPEPDREAIQARRGAWAAGWPPGTDLGALMARVGMTDQALDGWFRGDLQIAAYLDQRFGTPDAAGRASRLAEWITELRRRANIGGKIPVQAPGPEAMKAVKHGHVRP